MGSIMQRIKIEEAADGMTLAKPVLAENGTTLCREGTVLNDGIIDTLKRRDITKLKVEGHPIERPNEKPLEEILADLSLRFSKTENDLITSKIKKALIKQIKNEYEENL